MKSLPYESSEGIFLVAFSMCLELGWLGFRSTLVYEAVLRLTIQVVCRASSVPTYHKSYFLNYHIILNYASYLCNVLTREG
jgi:hypothetical protein